MPSQTQKQLNTLQSQIGALDAQKHCVGANLKVFIHYSLKVDFISYYLGRDDYVLPCQGRLALNDVL